MPRGLWFPGDPPNPPGLRTDSKILHLKMKQYGIDGIDAGPFRELRRDSLVTLVCSPGYLRRTSVTFAGARPLPFGHS